MQPRLGEHAGRERQHELQGSEGDMLLWLLFVCIHIISITIISIIIIMFTNTIIIVIIICIDMFIFAIINKNSIIMIIIIIIIIPRAAQGPSIEKGGWYGWKPSSSSNFSIRAFRVVSLTEAKRTVLYRAIRANRISIKQYHPPLFKEPSAESANSRNTSRTSVVGGVRALPGDNYRTSTRSRARPPRSSRAWRASTSTRAPTCMPNLVGRLHA